MQLVLFFLTANEIFDLKFTVGKKSLNNNGLNHSKLEKHNPLTNLKKKFEFYKNSVIIY